MQEIKQILTENMMNTQELKTKATCLWSNDLETIKSMQHIKGINDFPEPYECPYCHKINYSKGTIIFNMIHWNKPLCECKESIEVEEYRKKQEREEAIKQQQEEEKMLKRMKIERLFQESKMGERFKTRTFENFKVNDKNKKAYDIAISFTENFDKVKEQGIGIIFTGEYGTGKTHLACSIANTLINKGIPVIYGTSISLLGKIKESYNSNETSEWKLLDLYSDVDLLIIDDLGKEKPSEWVLEKLYYIINQRYENLKPIIITSNFNANDELINRLTVGDNISTAEAIISRLNEMCTGVSVNGEDYRRKN